MQSSYPTTVITWGKDMSASKHFEKIAWAVTALMLVITVLFMSGGVLGIEVMAHTMGYENRLFDNTRVHTMDIVMNDWDEFIDNATSEQYYVANVVIDGEAYKNVGIRGKGNTSLSTVSSLGSERYSFKIEFDQYDSTKSYHGLDKLSLNNLIQDSTMMKDYLTYTMMNEFGAAAPLCSFVYITVNGADWGLYLAVEGLEDGFLERNYGSDYGELYKPDSMSFGGGRGNGKDFDMNDFMSSSESAEAIDKSSRNSSSSQIPNMGSFDPSTMFGGGSMPNMGSFDFSQIPGMSQEESESSARPSVSGSFDFSSMGGFGMGSSDVKLQYIDDNISSYSNIWNNAKTDITEADQNRLIASLKKLSNGEQIESVVDIEQVIRYFVVHNYVCNGDSYTGSMIHNYYLYEEDGRLAMLPWDYNLAYGTFQGGNGQSTVNTPIDAPVSGGAGTDRPMWSWILSDESYTELYHQYYAEFLNTVDIQGIIENAYQLIKSDVAKDPTAFYSYEEFEIGVATMKQFCSLRSESISQQLANGETTTNMGYVDASGLTLSDMGSMGGSMGGVFGGRDMGRENTRQPNSAETRPTGYSVEEQGSIASGISLLSTDSYGGIVQLMMPGNFGGNMPEGFDPSQMPGMGGNMPEGIDPSQMPSDFGSSMPEGFENMFPGQSSDRSQSSRPSMGDMSGMGSMGSTTSRGNTQMQWLMASVLILGIGLVIAKLYKY